MNVKHNMRRRLGRWAIAMGMFLIVPGMLLLSFELGVLDGGYHMRLYDQFHSAEAAGITQGELAQTSDMIVDYLKGRRDDLLLMVEAGGESTPVFNERELLHMEDVRELFITERTLRTSFLGTGLILLIFGAFCAGEDRFRQIHIKSLISQAVWLAILAAVVVYIVLDFGRAFGLFHEVLFRNDLWLLDPRTDRMIRMMPEAFFGALALRGALFMAGGMACMAVASAIPHGIQKRSEKNR